MGGKRIEFQIGLTSKANPPWPWAKMARGGFAFHPTSPIASAIVQHKISLHYILFHLNHNFHWLHHHFYWLNHNFYCLLIKSPFLLVKSPFVLVKSPFLLVKSPCSLVKSPFLPGKINYFYGHGWKVRTTCHMAPRLRPLSTSSVHVALVPCNPQAFDISTTWYPYHQRINKNTGEPRSDFDFKFSWFRFLI